MRIRAIIITAIFLTNIVIISFAVLAGRAFVRSNVDAAQESDLQQAAVITDEFISSAIEALKLKVVEASFVISDYDKAVFSGALHELQSRYPNYIGAAVINEDGEVIGYAGEVPPPYSVIYDATIKRAFRGERVISTSIATENNGVVFYLAVPMPRDGNEILVVTLPGMYFTGLVEDVVVWNTGHVIIADSDGYIIADIVEELVQNRVNFINEAKTDTSPEILIKADTTISALRGESGVRRFWADGAERFCAYRPVSDSDEGWVLAVTVPLHSSPFRYIDRGLAVVGIVSLIISIIVAFIASHFVKKPYDEVVSLKETAETNSKFKSEFLANMSHEIRTPMNSIVGFTELAMDDKISKKTKDYLTNIQENSEWLLQIINDILDISKIEAGKMVLEKVPFDPQDLLNTCKTSIMPRALKKGLELSFYAEPVTGRKPVGDPIRLRQILINLLSNAIKFTDSGRIRLECSIINEQESSITVYVEVTDSGIGITKEQINKILTPFTQAESETTRKYGGTGLGLAITNNLLGLMGSKLNVESTPGSGSKFSFEITFDTIIATEEEMHEQHISQVTLEKPLFNGEILLCEDNPMNRLVICEHLSKVGLKCFVAENGRIGVDLIKRRIENGIKQFDLIFMDMHMPEMDGFEASEIINKMNLGIPIIAITANIMSDDKILYEESGMHGFVSKPFTSQELWHCLLKFLKPL
ncbi:MAG: ATP-binding protein [Oscillospiraceae bacterium]|nr:ATP-binding protein [Oscillospiraceae bacterium]